MNRSRWLGILFLTTTVMLSGCSENTPPEVPGTGLDAPESQEPASDPLDPPPESEARAPLPENVTRTGQWSYSVPIVSSGNADAHTFSLDRNATLSFHVSTTESTQLAFTVYTPDYEPAFNMEGDFGQPVAGSVTLGPGDYEAWSIMRMGALANYTVRLEFAEAGR